MRREHWVIAVAVAMLCIGGAAVWWLGRQAPPEPARVEMLRGEVGEIREPEGGIDEALAPEGVEPTEQEAAEDLDAKLEDYLGDVRQAYGSESQAYLDDGSPKVEIPVPPVDAVDRKVPRLRLPEPDEPAKRP